MAVTELREGRIGKHHPGFQAMPDIRIAQIRDAEALPAIEYAASLLYRTVPELAFVADMEDQTVQRHRELIAQGTSWVAADGDERLVAYLSAEPVAGALHVWGLYVHPDRQGAGIGPALLNAAIGEARRRGIAAVTLTTFRNLRWNEQFYRKLGFETLARVEPGSRLDEILHREFTLGLPEEWRCAMRLHLA